MQICSLTVIIPAFEWRKLMQIGYVRLSINEQNTAPQRD